MASRQSVSSCRLSLSGSSLSSLIAGVLSDASITCTGWLPMNSVTNISFLVRVPVLSEQMQSALPMVSQALSLRTRLFSLSMALTENASDKVTDSGSPSGMATTTTVIYYKSGTTAMTMACTMAAGCLFLSQPLPLTLTSMTNLIIKVRKVMTAKQRPNLPIDSASDSSFSCSGVSV